MTESPSSETKSEPTVKWIIRTTCDQPGRTNNEYRAKSCEPRFTAFKTFAALNPAHYIFHLIFVLFAYL